MVQDIKLGNRYAGYIVKGVFVCRRTKAEHLFKLWNGLGFNKNLIDRFTETGQVLSVAVQYFDGVKERVLTATPLHIALVATPWTNAKDLRGRTIYFTFERIFRKRKLTRSFNYGGNDMSENLEDDLEETDAVVFDNTVELSNKGFSQEMVQKMNQNQLKISKLKLEKLIKKKKQIKQYLKENLLTKGTKEA